MGDFIKIQRIPFNYLNFPDTTKTNNISFYSLNNTIHYVNGMFVHFYRVLKHNLIKI
jgi:hypothetical protein